MRATMIKGLTVRLQTDGEVNASASCYIDEIRIKTSKGYLLAIGMASRPSNDLVKLTQYEVLFNFINTDCDKIHIVMLNSGESHVPDIQDFNEITEVISIEATVRTATGREIRIANVMGLWFELSNGETIEFNEEVVNKIKINS